MPVVIGICGLLEAKRGVAQTNLAARVSILALVLVPLSFTMGLFSMSDTYQPDRPRFWTYWAVSVPLIGLTSLLMWLLKKGAFRWIKSKAEQDTRRKKGPKDHGTQSLAAV